MKDDLRFQLDQVLATHNSAEQKQAMNREDKVQRAALFLAQFYDVVAAAVRPAFAEMESAVVAHGLESKISANHEGRETSGTSGSASITLTVFVGGREGSSGAQDFPHITFRCNKAEEKVGLVRSTISPRRGGMAGLEGEYRLDEITFDFVQEKVVALLQEVLSR